MQVAESKVVAFQYTLTLESGEVIDSSEGKDPLSFLVNSGQIIPGLEKELIGLAAGDKKVVKVEPEEGYGVTDENLVQVIQRSQIPDSVDLKVGEMLRGQSEDGHVVEGKVIFLDEQEAKIDFNHPLADKVLNFDVEIVTVRDASAEELEHGHAH
jgi:FKBP-type peptidyl-prolyl cis-trans isomerase SlyD